MDYVSQLSDGSFQSSLAAPNQQQSLICGGEATSQHHYQLSQILQNNAAGCGGVRYATDKDWNELITRMINEVRYCKTCGANYYAIDNIGQWKCYQKMIDVETNIFRKVAADHGGPYTEDDIFNYPLEVANYFEPYARSAAMISYFKSANPTSAASGGGMFGELQQPMHQQASSIGGGSESVRFSDFLSISKRGEFTGEGGRSQFESSSAAAVLDTIFVKGIIRFDYNLAMELQKPNRYANPISALRNIPNSNGYSPFLRTAPNFVSYTPFLPTDPQCYNW